MHNRLYAVITPAHNEASFLPQVVKSIVNQKIPPVKWLIVDDRSTDNTLATALKEAYRHEMIDVIHLSGNQERRLGANVVKVFNQGLKKLHQQVDYLVKMDADVVLDKNYFADLMLRFESDPRLGIASGKLYVQHGSQWLLERCPDFHVTGACKMYRMSCFQDIGGLIPIYGWDILDCAKARMRGWKTSSFRDMTIRHLRMMGSAKGILRGHINHGIGMWTIRAHPLFVLGRAIYRAFELPYLSGLLIFAGYLYGGLRSDPRLKDLDLAKFLRKEQLDRLMGRKLDQEEFLPRRLKI